jgi:hypothetical protein
MNTLLFPMLNFDVIRSKSISIQTSLSNFRVDDEQRVNGINLDGL